MYTRFAQEWLANQPGLQPAQRDFLLEALRFYQEFAQEEGEDAQARYSMGLGLLRVADIQCELGDVLAAEQAGTNAVEVFSSLAREDATRSDYRRSLAEAELKQGMLAGRTGRSDEARRAFHRAASLRRTLVQEQAHSIEDRSALATVLNMINDRAALGESLEIANELLARDPRRPDTRLVVAKAHGYLGSFLYDQSDVANSEHHHREELRISRVLDREFPNQYRYQRQLLLALGNLGRDVGRQARHLEEEALTRDAFGVSRRLAQEFPALILTRANLAVSFFNLAEVHRNLGRYGESEKDYREGIAIIRGLIAENPEILMFQPCLANFRVGLGLLLEKIGRHREALETYREALGERERLPPHMLNAAGNLRDRAQANQCMARLLVTTPDLQLRDPTRAVGLATKATELSPTDADIWNTLGAVRYRAGDWTEAIHALRKAMDLRSGGIANDWLFLAMAHWQRGDKEAAPRWYDRASAWMDNNHTKDEELTRLRDEAAALLGLADQLKRIGKKEETGTQRSKP
jgi:tetratricopeptide (TPR) repeat protein